VDDTIQKFVEKTARLGSAAEFSQYGYLLYFVLFSVGAALWVGSVFVPKPIAAQMDSQRTYSSKSSLVQKIIAHRGHIQILGMFLLFLLCSVSLQTRLDQWRGFLSDQDIRHEKMIKEWTVQKGKDAAFRKEYLYLPEVNSMTLFSLNNPNLAADYVWLLSQKNVSNSFRRGHKFEMLSHFYETMQQLDPHWIEATLSAGAVLSVTDPDRFKVEKFYIQAIIRNPDCLPLFREAGLLFVVPALDPKQQPKYAARAVGWFQRLITKLKMRTRTASVEKQIVAYEDLVARMGIEAGYYKASAELLYKHATDSTTLDAVRSIAAQEWLTAHSMAQVAELNELSVAFQKSQGHFPETLNVLREKLPNAGLDYFKDAFGFPIEYDPISGIVSSKGVNTRRAIQAASVVNALLNVYYQAHQKYPHDLHELQTFVRDYFNASNPPNGTLYDSLGLDLNVRKGPLGIWNYDENQGIVILPDFCNVKTLFHNAERLWKKE
jgi:hypothetical protein